MGYILIRLEYEDSNVLESTTKIEYKNYAKGRISVLGLTPEEQSQWNKLYSLESHLFDTQGNFHPSPEEDGSRQINLEAPKLLEKVTEMINSAYTHFGYKIVAHSSFAHKAKYTFTWNLFNF